MKLFSLCHACMSCMHAYNIIHNISWQAFDFFTAPDPCISDPCDVNAKCTREGLISSVFTCLCGESFTGDGFNCSGKLRL